MASKGGRRVQTGDSDRLRPLYIQQKEIVRARQEAARTTIDPEFYFTCECCLQSFEKEKTDEEVKAQARKDYPDDDLSDAALVCDTCYDAIKRKLGGDVS